MTSDDYFQEVGEAAAKHFRDTPLVSVYFNFCANDYSGVGEKHHILPRSIFPEYAKCAWNIVNLKAEDHLLAHELLVHVLTGNARHKMLYALAYMDAIRAAADRRGISYADFKDELRELKRQNMTGEKNPSYGAICYWVGKTGPNKGRKFSDSTKLKLSLMRKGELNSRYGKRVSEETRRKIGAANSGANNYWYGKTTTEKQKAAAARTCLERKWTPEERAKIAYARSIPVEIDGVRFASQQAAAAHYGVTKHTIGRWVKSGRAKVLDKTSVL